MSSAGAPTSAAHGETPDQFDPPAVVGVERLLDAPPDVAVADPVGPEAVVTLTSLIQRACELRAVLRADVARASELHAALTLTYRQSIVAWEERDRRCAEELFDLCDLLFASLAEHGPLSKQILHHLRQVDPLLDELARGHRPIVTKDMARLLSRLGEIERKAMEEPRLLFLSELARHLLAGYLLRISLEEPTYVAELSAALSRPEAARRQSPGPVEVLGQVLQEFQPDAGAWFTIVRALDGGPWPEDRYFEWFLSVKPRLLGRLLEGDLAALERILVHLGTDASWGPAWFDAHGQAKLPSSLLASRVRDADRLKELLEPRRNVHRALLLRATTRGPVRIGMLTGGKVVAEFHVDFAHGKIRDKARGTRIQFRPEGVRGLIFEPRPEGVLVRTCVGTDCQPQADRADQWLPTVGADLELRVFDVLAERLHLVGPPARFECAWGGGAQPAKPTDDRR